jgi:hypothetical protein
MNPTYTYIALLIVQTGHLFHHRFAKRHISFAEVASSLTLCFPPFVIALPGIVFVSMHLLLIGVQVIGSFRIRELSPQWSEESV